MSINRLIFFILTILPSLTSLGFKPQNIDSLRTNWENTYNKEKLNKKDIQTLNEYTNKLYNNHLLPETYLNLERILIYANNTQDTILISKTKINIGNLLFKIGAETEAKEYFIESLKLSQLKEDTIRIIICNLNLSTLFIETKLKDNDSALHYAKQSYELSKRINHGQSLCYSNDKLIAYYINNKETNKALALITENIKLKDSLNISTKDNHFQRVIALKNNGTTSSIEYLSELTLYLKKSKEEENKSDIKKGQLLLSDYYDSNNQKLKAYEYLKKIYAIEKLTEFNKVKPLYKHGQHDEHILIFERVQKQKFQEIQKQKHKNHELQLTLEKIKTTNEIEKSQKYFITLLSIILIVIIILFLLNKTINQKRVIEESNSKFQKQHIEITSSITYAKRIQNAILPPTKTIEETFKDSFLIYTPKDIVSGDFYWLEKINNKICFAVADCTGHGVPGAMVSVICNNGLNRSVREHQLESPNKILDKTREIVIQEFEKAGEDIKDGMDISLIVWNEDTNSIQFSGANNSIWIIRQATEKPELFELKGDKQPIGNFERSFPFTTKEFNLKKDDIVYLSSDGYADQFGGERNKKIKSVNFKKLLLENSHLKMAEQKDVIQTFFNEWKGDNEQLDDVCVVGIRF